MGLQELCDLDRRDGELPGRLVRGDQDLGEEVPADAGRVPLRPQGGPADRGRRPVSGPVGDGGAPAALHGAAQIAAVMSLEDYPLSVAPDIDQSRVQRVADAMYQFQMLTHPFQSARCSANRARHRRSAAAAFAFAAASALAFTLALPFPRLAFAFAPARTGGLGWPATVIVRWTCGAAM